MIKQPLALMALLISMSVNAALVEQDWHTQYDRLLTLDTNTGLVWLDLSVTQGNSLLDTEQESFFGQFRWATAYEINRLMDNGLAGSGYRNTFGLASSIEYMIKKLSPLSHSVYTNDGGVRGVVDTHVYSAGGFTRSNDGEMLYANMSYRDAWAYDPAWYNFGFVSDASSLHDYNESTSMSNMGSWLVLDPAAEVPVPAAVWLFSSALIGLVSMKRKK